ncbi:MAG: flagellar hook-length control protein FliK [Thermodesulfobacteriota bacterium]|nr:flagellar hook-length control protein FliK [Thermodesulfobacteriota bacterium]
MTRNSIKLSLSRDQGRDFVPKLYLDEILKARVVRSFGDNRAVIQLKGSEILAETGTPLPKGSTFNVRVEQLQPRVILNPLPEQACAADKPTALLKSYLPNQTPLGDIIQRLQGILAEKWLAQDVGFDKAIHAKLEMILSNIVFNDKKMFQSSFLLNLITQSGLVYESKIKRLLSKSQSMKSFGGVLDTDLKGMLMKILEGIQLREGTGNSVLTMQGFSKENVGYLHKLLQELVDNIELNQITNCVTKDEGNYVYLQIPLAFQDRIDNADFYLFYGPKGKEACDQREDFSLVFLLNVEELGHIRVDTSVKKTDVFCRFTVENHEVAEFINDLLPQLRDRLLSLGYTVEGMDCLVTQDSSHMEIGPLENLMTDSVRFVDVKV